MKIRESGMPEEALWQGFFEPEAILDRLGLHRASGDVAEFGCGYGTFTLPVAGRCDGIVHAFDIEPDMLERTRARAAQAGLRNVRPALRDFEAQGTGLADGSVEWVMIFNILHLEAPVELLGEARRIVAPDGVVAVIHWNHDPDTPRGPPLAIRPRPAQCLEWAREAGLAARASGPIDLPPYHYGLTLRPGHPGATHTEP